MFLFWACSSLCSELGTGNRYSLTVDNYHFLLSRSSTLQPKTTFIFLEVWSHHGFTLNLLLTKMTKPQLLVYFSRYSFWIKIQDIVFIAISYLLRCARCSRPAEISRGERVGGSWFYHPKHFPSLQVSWDHKFENVLCLLINTKLEPGSMVLETFL